MATEWDDWLRELARSGKGGVRLAAASRGRKYELNFELPGTFTGYTMRGQVRSSPDAPGTPLATFSVTGPVVADGNSTFTAVLSEAATASLPADGDFDGVAMFPVDFLLGTSGNEELLLGAVLPVAGRITV